MTHDPMRFPRDRIYPELVRRRGGRRVIVWKDVAGMVIGLWVAGIVVIAGLTWLIQGSLRITAWRLAGKLAGAAAATAFLLWREWKLPLERLNESQR